MLTIEIPGYHTLQLLHLVLDHNGTLALDGKLLPGVGHALADLSGLLAIHVLTADTFGLAAAELEGLPLTLSVLPGENQAEGKKQYIEVLGSEQCVCIGNGRNDRLMLAAAALGIAVVQQECAAAETLQAANVVAPDIFSALALLGHPLRLTATLRS